MIDADSPATKRHRVDLSGTVIYVDKRVSSCRQRLQIWIREIPKLGGNLVEDPSRPNVTHVITESTYAARLPPQLLPGSRGGTLPPPFLVTPEWLPECIAKQRRMPEADFAVRGSPEDTSVGESGVRHGDTMRSKGKKGAKFGSWLGHWKDEYEDMNMNELMLQATYSIDRSEALGNQPVVDALRELEKYELAVGGDSRVGGYDAFGTDTGHRASRSAPGQRHRVTGSDQSEDKAVINHRALKYARTAASVRACAVKLEVSPHGKLTTTLPYVGAAQEKQISDIIRTGTCTQLDQFRANQEVQDSHGTRRRDSVGGASKRAFVKLPEVGTAAAKRWFDAGCRTYEDVEWAYETGRLLARGKFEKAQYFSLLHRRDLLQAPTAEDMEEMKAATLAALEAVDGPGWQVVTAGGAARGLPGHDADFLVTHDTDPDRPAAGWVIAATDELLTRGHLVGDFPYRQQKRRMATHLADIKKDATAQHASAAHNLTQDRFDHLFGVFRSSRGKMTRMDLIFVPRDEFAFGYLGWVGSRQYLRFLRQHAQERGMHLNSHRLTAVQGDTVWLVPDEGPPLNRNKERSWPAGWNQQRRVSGERDIFELLGVPYRPPSERNCG